MSDNREIRYIELPPSIIYGSCLEGLNMEKQFDLGKNLSGPIINGCPVIGVHIFNAEYPTNTLIDTGAFEGIIRTDYAQFLIKAASLKVKRREWLNNAALGDIEVDVYDIPFTIKGVDYEFVEEFAVLPANIVYPVFLGRKFLMKCKEFHYYSVERKFDLIL